MIASLDEKTLATYYNDAFTMLDLFSLPSALTIIHRLIGYRSTYNIFKIWCIFCNIVVPFYFSSPVMISSSRNHSGDACPSSLIVLIVAKTRPQVLEQIDPHTSQLHRHCLQHYTTMVRVCPILHLHNQANSLSMIGAVIFNVRGVC